MVQDFVHQPYPRSVAIAPASPPFIKGVIPKLRKLSVERNAGLLACTVVPLVDEILHHPNAKTLPKWACTPLYFFKNYSGCASPCLQSCSNKCSLKLPGGARFQHNPSCAKLPTLFGSMAHVFEIVFGSLLQGAACLHVCFLVGAQDRRGMEDRAGGKEINGSI